MFIRRDRLFLRPGWPEDWQELFTRIGDEGVVRNLATAPWPYTERDAQTFAATPQDRRLPHFFVTLPSSTGPAELIGSVGLGESDGEVELGYWFARAHWGKGYATEAAGAVLRLAKVLGHDHLVAGHFMDNPASGRVLRKIGFRPTGRLRERFSLARGYKAQSVEHRITLGNPCDCDGGGDADMVNAMRAA